MRCAAYILFQERLQANVTLGEEKVDNSTNFEPERRSKNVLTDEMKNMMVELLKRRQRHRRESTHLDATRQTIDTCLSYAELWSRISERDARAPSHIGDWLCDVECRAKDDGKVSQLVSGMLSKRLLMSLWWESGFQGRSHRESCECKKSSILQRLYSHTNQNDGQWIEKESSQFPHEFQGPARALYTSH